MANTAKLRLTAVSRTHPGYRYDFNQDAVYLGKRLFAVADGMGGHAHGEVASAVAIEVLAELEAAIGLGKFAEVEEAAARGAVVSRGKFAEVGDAAARGAVVGRGGKLRPDAAELEAAIDQGKSVEVGDAAERGAVVDEVAALVSATGEVLRRLNELAACDSGLHGMGTTITALLWDGAVVTGVHIGDSRAYRWRAGDLVQITRDHTFVQSLLDSGRITAEEAAAHPRQHLLVRAVQTGGSAEPDVFAHRARAGDRYLICSDGLTAVLADETIAGILADAVVPDDAVDQLVDLALRGGAPDNVSVVLADVSDRPRSGHRKYFWRQSG